jgi:hypothetical protein
VTFALHKRAQHGKVANEDVVSWLPNKFDLIQRFNLFLG